jgi:tRNA(Ile2) C34 agmatinyltransferase TiaS
MTTSLRYDTVTVICPVCGAQFPASGRRRYCSPGCKQQAWRDRHARPAPPARTAQADTVYVCPQCETRYLGGRRCPDCNLFTRSLGPGAPCPHCDEPIAISDIITDYQPTKRSSRRQT